MNRAVKIMLIILASIAGVYLLLLPVNRFYFAPRKELTSKIENSTIQLAKYRQAQDDQPRVNREVESFVDRTLGGDLENVDHQLRTRLRRLAEHVQLQGFNVNTVKAAKPCESPAKSKFIGASNRDLQKELDFYELEGSLSGYGTFEQVLRLVDGIESEPWIKRIDQLKLDPKDNGERFDVAVRLTTVFLPGRTPNPAHAAAANASGFDRYQALLSRQPFRVPPPPPQAKSKPITDPDPPGPPPFPYDHWALTGFAQSSKGPEVWLFNKETKEAKHLAIGESLHDAVLTAATADSAEFRLGDKRFAVAIGKNLGDRVPISQ